MRSIFNSTKIILKSEKAFSILDEAFEKGNILIQACVMKSFLILDKKKACPRKGILIIPWRHSESAHRFGQRRHDFLSKASRVQLEKLKHKNFFFWASENNDLHASKKNGLKNKKGDQFWSITSGSRSISISDGRNLPHEVDKVRTVHGGHLEA